MPCTIPWIKKWDKKEGKTLRTIKISSNDNQLYQLL